MPKMLIIQFIIMFKRDCQILIVSRTEASNAFINRFSNISDLIGGYNKSLALNEEI